MKKTYTGGCQCGKVRYEAQAEIGEVITCNCSRCRKLGPLFAASSLTLMARARVAETWSCSTCAALTASTWTS